MNEVHALVKIVKHRRFNAVMCALVAVTTSRLFSVLLFGFIFSRHYIHLLPLFRYRATVWRDGGVFDWCYTCVEISRDLQCTCIAWDIKRMLLSLWPPASSLADGHYILLLMFLSSYLLFFRRLISEVSGPIVTKLCHMFDGDCNF